MFKFLGVILLGIIAVCVSCANPMAGTNSGFLPVEGEYQGLVPDGKRKTYIINRERDQYLGNNVVIFDNYGLSDFFHNEYTFNGKENYLSIESYQLSGENGAAGVFYYFVRRKLKTKGKEVDVGADGVLDVVNDSRNLYFFKGRWFFAIVYSGKGDVPDLIPLGRYIASKVPGNNWKPDGFRYLDVEGIASKYAYVSAGNAMNFAFLPPSVTTFVSSVGLESNIYISNYFEEKAAEEAEDNFKKFMTSNCEDYKKSEMIINGRNYPIRQALDEKEGLLMFVRYKKTIISISKVSDYDIARVLMERVVRKIMSTNSSNNSE